MLQTWKMHYIIISFMGLCMYVNLYVLPLKLNSAIAFILLWFIIYTVDCIICHFWRISSWFQFQLCTAAKTDHCGKEKHLFHCTVQFINISWQFKANISSKCQMLVLVLQKLRQTASSQSDNFSQTATKAEKRKRASHGAWVKNNEAFEEAGHIPVYIIKSLKTAWTH